MNTLDVMTVFRQIIGYIARIDAHGWIEVEHVAQDMGVEISDLRIWLRLMKSLELVVLISAPEMVILRLATLDSYGFDISKLKDL